MTWVDWFLACACMVMILAIIYNLLEASRIARTLREDWPSLEQTLVSSQHQTPDDFPGHASFTEGKIYAVTPTLPNSQGHNTSLINPLSHPAKPPGTTTAHDAVMVYVASIKSARFHTLDCPWVKRIQENNRQYFEDREQALSSGYEPCGVCNP